MWREGGREGGREEGRDSSKNRQFMKMCSTDSTQQLSITSYPSLPCIIPYLTQPLLPTFFPASSPFLLSVSASLPLTTSLFYLLLSLPLPPLPTCFPVTLPTLLSPPLSPSYTIIVSSPPTIAASTISLAFIYLPYPSLPSLGLSPLHQAGWGSASWDSVVQQIITASWEV